MKILYHFRTQGTGAEGVHISGVAEAFEQLGHSVQFSSPTGIDPRKTAGESPFGKKQKRSFLSRLAAKSPSAIFELLEIGYNFLAYFRNRSLLKEKKFDLIYERHAFFLGSTAMLARSWRIPLVVEVNELPGDERIRSEPRLAILARRADRITFSNASLIVVVSPHLKRRIEQLGVPSARILVLPNAVSEDTLSVRPRGAAVRNQYGFKDAVVIGFVGWFVAWHRLDNLLEQFGALAPKYPDVKLMLVGDGILKSDLIAQAERLSISDRVIFTGPVSHNDIPSYIEAMDICVVPHSNAYRSPIKLFEYMAQSRAVLSARTEPIEMVIRDSENGSLFDTDDPEDLRVKLEQLISHPAYRKMLGERAREDVREHYTWKSNAEMVLESIRQLPHLH